MKRERKYIDPDLLIAVEFGYRMLEKGRSLEFAKAEFVRVRSASGVGHKLRRSSR